jgi:hypothetical protein
LRLLGDRIDVAATAAALARKKEMEERKYFSKREAVGSIDVRV